VVILLSGSKKMNLGVGFFFKFSDSKIEYENRFEVLALANVAIHSCKSETKI
jgi:hypothetical protein